MAVPQSVSTRVMPLRPLHSYYPQFVPLLCNPDRLMYLSNLLCMLHWAQLLFMFVPLCSGTRRTWVEMTGQWISTGPVESRADRCASLQVYFLFFLSLSLFLLLSFSHSSFIDPSTSCLSVLNFTASTPVHGCVSAHLTLQFYHASLSSLSSYFFPQKGYPGL